MNLETLIEEVNKDLDDTLDNAELTGWMNRCMDELTPIAPLQTMTTILLVTGQSQYDLPSDFMRLVQLVNEYPMQRIRINDLFSCGFKLWGNKLMIQPTPTEDGSVDLYYEAKLPYLVNMTDEPQFPSQFHDLLILYTVAKARYQDEEESLQMNVWSDYKRRKDEFIAFMAQDSVNTIEEVYTL